MAKIVLRDKKEKRKLRVRKKISGDAVRPRISVFKSNKFIYAQLIDDVARVTLASSQGAKDMESAFKVGEKLAALALEKGIKRAVYDRGGFRYHGKVKQLAEGARKGGLEL